MMSFSFFDVLLMIGITQGLVAVPLLLFARDKRLSNVFLALAILSFCLLFFKILINFTGLARDVPFRYFPNAFELATAPLFYFYVVALTKKGFTWKWKFIKHFIPFIIAQFYAFFIYGSVYTYPTAVIQDEVAHQLYYKLFKEIEDWAIVVSILSYLYLGYRRFIAFQQQVRNSTADSAYPTLSWLRNILVLSIVLWLFLLSNMTLSRLTDLEMHTDLHWKVYFVYIASITYYLSFMAYRQQAPDLDQIYPSELKSANKKASCAETEKLANSFRHLLEQQKIYLEPTLNIRQVAERLDVSQSNFSQVVNTHFDKSFRELINEYRIEDVKEKLLDRQSKVSILSLALESGFNSEASFYRVFKNKTGVSPKEFINQNATTV
ncbi:helix-turn-helix domain-containing protein [Aliikangiella coralliicola]|uniref:AraC family transcriptional regulator n=1 Tax=Aliikangiella coralliicola TaxID=2592383 RepID=A0A545UII9_9GAMM|nr:helix-turn-helix domain-containing protein [Aliikangiella coralliicola]TQV89278.1 AraC family transcriptional regulator [Aliikangiella coralliicola]